MHEQQHGAALQSAEWISWRPNDVGAVLRWTPHRHERCDTAAQCATQAG